MVGPDLTNKPITGDPDILIQIFVFKKGEYLGWDCFPQAEVTFGSTSQAELQLDDQEDFLAKVTIDGDTLEIWNIGTQENVYVNGKPIRTYAQLGPFDQVSVGSYKLKIKARLKIVHQAPPVVMADNDDAFPNSEPHDSLFEFEIAHRNLHLPEEQEDDDAAAQPPVDDPGVNFTDHENDKEDEDDDEADSDDVERAFLKEALINKNDGDDLPSRGAKALKGDFGATASPHRLEVVKYRQDQVYDLQFLAVKQKYTLSGPEKTFCLAEHRSPDKSFLFYHPGLKIKSFRQATEEMGPDHFFDQRYLYRKRARRYRYPLPDNGEVVISDGYFDYRIRNMALAPSAQVEDPPNADPVLLNNIVKSTLIHFFLLVLVGLCVTMPTPEQQAPVSRFVQIDTQQLSQKIKPPPIRKKKPPAVKPQPQQVAQVKPAPAKPRKSKTRSIAKSKAKSSKKRRAKSTPAGRMAAVRGTGNGNVANRNIKQVGILGMLGSTVGITPNEAIAAVSNIDAVASSHSNEASLKISGIVGALGNTKIQIPQGESGVVTTKGSTQVLRSGGGNGRRTVGVLHNGGTGQGRVLAMVKTDVEQTFRVRGGMSRAAVQRVIDQHLDEIQYCYENVLLAHPALMGKITFEWKILMSGHVGAISIKKSTVHSSELHECMKASLKKWQFPRPKGSEVIVSRPFIFNTVGF